MTLYLDVVGDAGGVHARGHIHSVSPDVVLWFACADHAGHHWPDVDAYPTRNIR